MAETHPLYLTKSQWQILNDATYHYAGVMADHAKDGDEDARVIAPSAERLWKEVHSFEQKRQRGEVDATRQGLALPYADVGVLALAMEEWHALMDDDRDLFDPPATDADLAAAQHTLDDVRNLRSNRFPSEYLQDHPEERFSWAIKAVMDGMAENYQEDAGGSPEEYGLEEGERLEWDAALDRAWDTLHTVHGVEGWKAVVDDWLDYQPGDGTGSLEEANWIWDFPEFPKYSEWNDAVLTKAMNEAL